MGWLEGDRSAGEEYEREGGLGGVESVGAADDQPDFVVERFGAALVDFEADRGEDPVAMFADCFAEADERFKAAAGGAAEEPPAAPTASTPPKPPSRSYS